MINSIIDFFKECWNEIHNITWPTQKTATHSVIVVCTSMILVGFVLAFFDGVFTQVVEKLITLK